MESGRWPEQTAYCTAGQATKVWAVIVDAMEDEALAYHKTEGEEADSYRGRARELKWV